MPDKTKIMSKPNREDPHVGYHLRSSLTLDVNNAAVALAATEEAGAAMANEEQKQEIDDKVTALAKTRFGGDYNAAFAHYGADGNGMNYKDELKALSDAGIGSGLTRWAWANRISPLFHPP